MHRQQAFWGDVKVFEAPLAHVPTRAAAAARADAKLKACSDVAASYASMKHKHTHLQSMEQRVYIHTCRYTHLCHAAKKQPDESAKPAKQKKRPQAYSKPKHLFNQTPTCPIAMDDALTATTTLIASTPDKDPAARHCRQQAADSLPQHALTCL